MWEVQDNYYRRGSAIIYAFYEISEWGSGRRVNVGRQSYENAQW